MGIRYALGFALCLWVLNGYFGDTFSALDDAATASLNTIEAVATKSTEQIDVIIVP